MKERLDILLVERRLVESRVKAQWLIKNGYVVVNDMEMLKPGKRIENTSIIRLKQKFPYVGRGGLKLEAALKEFSIVVKGKVCVDIGASIGGFTDCLLQKGALKVYAVDTAKDLLHPSLRCKKNEVIELLGVDARKLKSVPTNVDIVTIDVTFSSLKFILPNIKNYLKKKGDIIVLIKPLFETNYREELHLKKITDLSILKKILRNLIEWCLKYSFFPKDLIVSPLLGKGGSIEFLLYLKIDKDCNFNFEHIAEKLFRDVKKLLSNYKDSF
ncbi:MAG: TlyA family RNA methyltransferase [Candidatus Lokiarchaeota archaeon]|nr:TlyA family RNA methyltransferase [Candidatus Lokiarchaeota archaeon]